MARPIDNRMSRLNEIVVEFGDMWGIENPTVRSRNSVGDGPIHLVTGRNEVDLLEVVIAHGESVNERGEFQWTPLHMAVCCKAWAAIEKLISLGADVTLRDDLGETPVDMLRDETDVPAHILKLLGAA